MHDLYVKNSPSLPGNLAERFRTQPSALALVIGSDRITYGELADMSDSTRAYLESPGLRGLDRIAVQATKSPQTIAVIIACLMTSRPCLLPSTRLGLDSLGALLDRAGCAGLLTASAAGSAGIGVQYSARPTAPEDGGIRPAGPGADACLMLTTSGSTGLPKVVPLSASAVDRFTAWAITRFGLSPVTAVLNYAPLSFDLCLLDIWATLAAGGTAVLVEEDRATDGRYLAECVRGQEVSVIQSVPMLYRLLADAYGGDPFRNVKHVITTGDKIPARLLSELPRLFPAAQLYNLYGCTETNDSFLHEVTESDVLGELPIGRPLPGVDALVADADGTILDGPAVGELLVRTPFQTAGYVGLGADVGRFVDIDDGRPFFRSGDLFAGTQPAFAHCSAVTTFGSRSAERWSTSPRSSTSSSATTR